MRRFLLLHTASQLMRLTGLLLDQLERTHADEPITAGDPGGRYMNRIEAVVFCDCERPVGTEHAPGCGRVIPTWVGDRSRADD